jgi:DNA-directed RNA polymerase specialized sigma24 family protein
VLINVDRRRHVLRRIAYRLTAEVVFGEDLIREATVRLWFVKEQRLERRRGWLLQTCAFRLNDRMRAGSSVESVRLRHAEVSTYSMDDDEHIWGESARCVRGANDRLDAHEVLNLFGTHAGEFETEILTCLTCQMGTREIASRIAELAVRLAIPPLLKPSRDAILAPPNRRR